MNPEEIFKQLLEQMNNSFAELDKRFDNIEKDIKVIKAAVVEDKEKI